MSRSQRMHLTHTRLRPSIAHSCTRTHTHRHDCMGIAPRSRTARVTRSNGVSAFRMRSEQPRRECSTDKRLSVFAYPSCLGVYSCHRAVDMSSAVCGTRFFFSAPTARNGCAQCRRIEVFACIPNRNRTESSEFFREIFRKSPSKRRPDFGVLFSGEKSRKLPKFTKNRQYSSIINSVVKKGQLSFY